jgi:mono/diheme cytochrome c family protein
MGTEDGGSRMDDAGSELPTDAGPIADGGTVTIDGGSVTTDAGNMPTDAGTITGPSWSAEVYPLISSNCSPCHTERASGALDMSSATAAYADLVDVDAAGPACGSGSRVRVVPGDAAGSLLYQKVAGTHDCGSQMPLAAPALSDGQIATIGDWIDAGASDD